MDRIQRGIRLALASWQVLRSDKALLILPIVSTAAILVFASAVLSPALVSDVHRTSPGVVYLLLAAVYFVAVVVATFSNAAIVAAATDRMQGGPGSVSHGLRVAWSRIHNILAWSVVAATVGLVIRALEERFGIVGQILVRLFGAAWSVLTFFVVPVLVYEQVGPIDAVRRSGTLFRQRWGEQLVGNGSISAALIILAFPLALLCGLLASVSGPLAIAVGVAGFGALLAVGSALSGIFNAALYQYAVGGQVTGPFSAADFQGAFRPRRSGAARGGFGTGFGTGFNGGFGGFRN